MTVRLYKKTIKSFSIFQLSALNSQLCIFPTRGSSCPKGQEIVTAAKGRPVPIKCYNELYSGSLRAMVLPFLLPAGA